MKASLVAYSTHDLFVEIAPVVLKIEAMVFEMCCESPGCIK